jgi:hypothetical protein
MFDRKRAFLPDEAVIAWSGLRGPGISSRRWREQAGGRLTRGRRRQRTLRDPRQTSLQGAARSVWTTRHILYATKRTVGMNSLARSRIARRSRACQDHERLNPHRDHRQPEQSTHCVERADTDAPVLSLLARPGHSRSPPLEVGLDQVPCLFRTRRATIGDQQEWPFATRGQRSSTARGPHP